MTARILPKEEYHRLAGTEAEHVWPTLADDARVVVVERDGAIVGCHVLMRFWHLECLWIAPAARGRGGVARRLWRAVRETAAQMGVGAAMTTAIDDRVRGLLTHVGAQPLPGEFYAVPLRGER